MSSSPHPHPPPSIHHPPPSTTTIIIIITSSKGVQERIPCLPAGAAAFSRGHRCKCVVRTSNLRHHLHLTEEWAGPIWLHDSRIKSTTIEHGGCRFHGALGHTHNSQFSSIPVELCSPHTVRMLRRLCSAHPTRA